MDILRLAILLLLVLAIGEAYISTATPAVEVCTIPDAISLLLLWLPIYWPPFALYLTWKWFPERRVVQLVCGAVLGLILPLIVSGYLKSTYEELRLERSLSAEEGKQLQTLVAVPFIHLQSERGDQILICRNPAAREELAKRLKTLDVGMKADE